MEWFNVFLVILFLFVLTIIFVFCRLYINAVPPITTKYNNIKNNLQTGDIFLIAYDSIYGHLVKVFKGCCWTHGSLVYKKNNKIYIIEIARYGDEDVYKGLLMIPIDKWLEFNEGKVIGYVKYRSSGPTKSIEKLFNKFKGIKVNLNTIYWMNTLVKWKHYNEKRKKYFCTEFLAKFLQDLGMISKKYLPCSYSPATFPELKEYTSDVKIFININ